MEKERIKSNGVALIPFLLFIFIYLGAGIYFDLQGVEMAFYQFPAPTTVLIGVVLAFIMFRGSVDSKFNTFLKGCSDENIIIMCFIYLLAGAFSAVASETGGVASFVNFGLGFVPARYMTAGIFLISAAMSTSIGTSMGTIAAVGPIAVGITKAAGLSMPLTMAALMGGAMFGDNLSVISDTTIAATRTQGVEMRDKFRLNFAIAMPAALITTAMLFFAGAPKAVAGVEIGDYSIIKILPYAVVLITALMGVNVFAVLTLGLALSSAAGVATGTLTFLSFGKTVYNGMAGMLDVFLTSLFIGGLAEMTRKAGGLQFLIEKIQKMIRGRKSAELGIAALASATDFAVANNTVAIIIDGPIAKEITQQYRIDPRRTASLLDIFTCIWQGVIPYGAQMLLLGAIAGGAVSAADIIPFLWYQMLLAVFAVISIFVPFADGVIRDNPWNWEKGTDEKRLRRLEK